MEKITEVSAPPGGWVITHHEHDEKAYELVRDSPGYPWKCPSCGKTVAQIFKDRQ